MDLTAKKTNEILKSDVQPLCYGLTSDEMGQILEGGGWPNDGRPNPLLDFVQDIGKYKEEVKQYFLVAVLCAAFILFASLACLGFGIKEKCTAEMKLRKSKTKEQDRSTAAGVAGVFTSAPDEPVAWSGVTTALDNAEVIEVA